MSWSEPIIINAVPDKWILTKPVEGNFFKISHDISNLPPFYFQGVIAQAEIVNGQLLIYDLKLISAIFDYQEVFSFVKPQSFTNRCLAIKANSCPLLAAGQVWNWVVKISKGDFSKSVISAGNSVVTNGLIAEYLFNQMSGQQLTDTSGNGNHGILGNSSSTDSQDPGWVSWANCGLDFSGNEYVQIPNNVWFNGDLTIEVCVYPRSYPNYSKIISLGNGQSSDNVLLNLSFSNSGQPSLQIFNGSTDGGSIRPSNSIPLLEWSYLQATLSGTSGRLYRNSTLWASGTTATPNNVNRTLNYIGKSHWNNEYFDGIISLVRFYNRALTTSERINNYLTSKNNLASLGIFI